MEAYKCVLCFDPPSQRGHLSGPYCTVPHYLCRRCYDRQLKDYHCCPICRVTYMSKEDKKTPAKPIYHFFGLHMEKLFSEERKKQGLETESRIQKKNMRPSVINLKCKYCGKQCFSRSNFYTHVNLHINGPLECKVCKNIYHNRYHDCKKRKNKGIKIVRCEQCDAWFVNKSNLRRHIKSKICLTCKICQKVFRSHKILMLHHHEPSRIL